MSQWTKDNVHEKLLEDIILQGQGTSFLDKDTTKWTLKDLEENDGGCNFIFLLSDGSKTLLVKWSSPWIRSMPGFPLDQNRGVFEREFLILSNSLYPGSIPKVYFYSTTRFYVAMEYLEGFSNFKSDLIKGKINGQFAAKVGEYTAIRSFKTSNLALKPSEMLENTSKFLANTGTRGLCDYLNYGIYYDPKNNEKYSEKVKKAIIDLQSTEKVLDTVVSLKTEMLENIQCLLHGDFHTGSVLIKGDQLFIIDAEATTMGPIAYDFGIMFGNLVLAYCFQDAFEKESGERKELKTWILKTLCETYDIFEKNFTSLWSERESFKKEYMARIFNSAVGYTGITVLRSAVERWPEYRILNDEKKGEAVSLQLISIAKSLLSESFTSWWQVTEMIEFSK